MADERERFGLFDERSTFGFIVSRLLLLRLPIQCNEKLLATIHLGISFSIILITIRIHINMVHKIINLPYDSSDDLSNNKFLMCDTLE